MADDPRAVLAQIADPACPNGHGPMALRLDVTAIAATLGTWWDCAPGPADRTCTSSVLVTREERGGS